MIRLGLAPIVAGLLAGAAACGGGATGDGDRPVVVASFYPLAWVAEELAGGAADVVNLTVASAEPHDLELTPRDVGRIVDADLVVYLEGFQPAVDEAIDHVARAARFDVAGAADLVLDADGSEGDHGHGDADPHFWLDPTRLAAVAEAVADRLVELAPDEGAAIERRAADLRARLTDLDEAFARGLASCARRELVTSHRAFAYLAHRYDLEQHSVAGVDAEAEPAAADLAAVAALVEARGVTTIFVEPLVSTAVARTVAEETGAATAVLDPLEGLGDDAAGSDYLEVMAANLTALRAGLGCP